LRSNESPERRCSKKNARRPDTERAREGEYKLSYKGEKKSRVRTRGSWGRARKEEIRVMLRALREPLNGVEANSLKQGDERQLHKG